MGRMKIDDGPRYKKTGSPLQKRQRRVQEVADGIFAQLLARPSQNTRTGRTALGLARKSEQPS